MKIKNIPIKIIDNFFEAPLLWKEYAQSQKYDYFKELPGLLRTETLDNLDFDVFQSLSSLIIQHIPDRYQFEKLFSFFRLAKNDFQEGYIPPQDSYFNVAGVIFLNDVFLENTGITLCDETPDLDPTIKIENRYNRCIIYPITQLIKHEGTFGDNNDNSRITLEFFGKAI